MRKKARGKEFEQEQSQTCNFVHGHRGDKSTAISTKLTIKHA